jgi:hypothetical protein
MTTDPMPLSIQQHHSLSHGCIMAAALIQKCSTCNALPESVPSQVHSTADRKLQSPGSTHADSINLWFRSI